MAQVRKLRRGEGFPPLFMPPEQFLHVFVILDCNSLQHVNVAVFLGSFSQVHFNEVCVAEGVVGGSPLCLVRQVLPQSLCPDVHCTVFVSRDRAHLLHGSSRPC